MCTVVIVLPSGRSSVHTALYCKYRPKCQVLGATNAMHHACPHKVVWVWLLANHGLPASLRVMAGSIIHQATEPGEPQG